MFKTLDVPLSASVYDDCNAMVRASNRLIESTLAGYKNNWLLFWDGDLSAEQMQAQLDTLGDNLPEFFAKARRFIEYILVEKPDAFSDTAVDTTGQCQRYLSPGWTYRMDGSRLIVIAPCEWVME